jgi:alanyl-tRNA synthetase
MKSSQIRQKYIEFFKSKGHKEIPQASLVPENDPTVLFTTAGMHPLVPYLLGEKHPDGTRLVNVQRCLRTEDIDLVGDQTHNTFFEMLGNWSFGDPSEPDGIGQAGYWKKEAIGWSWEFLTKELGIDKDRIAVSCFVGDDDAPQDTESVEIWKGLGVSEDRIALLGKEDNWWGPAGNTGPCGPDTEMFVWTGKSNAPAKFDPQDKSGSDGWIEVWNDVFMQYNKTADGKYLPLEQRNVDTGMGLERTAMVLQKVDSVYDTDTFLPIIEKVRECGAVSDVEARIVADHIKSSIFLLMDGVVPSNREQGYVARRLIRKVALIAHRKQFTNNWVADIGESLIEVYASSYPNLSKHKAVIVDSFRAEVVKFESTIHKGLSVFENYTKDKTKITGGELFDLYQSYGFPVELSRELAKERSIEIDSKAIEEYKAALTDHQEVSRKGLEKKFKGGLADHSEMSTKYHTATHLLHQGLRDVLGDHVQQKGSNITAERLRFDFTHKDKMTHEQISAVETAVNKVILDDIPVTSREVSLVEAKESGALGFFEEKYGEKVKVYSVGDYSKEICGGPHVEHTGVLGKFKITNEVSSSQGIRRIKAILE